MYTYTIYIHIYLFAYREREKKNRFGEFNKPVKIMLFTTLLSYDNVYELSRII